MDISVMMGSMNKVTHAKAIFSAVLDHYKWSYGSHKEFTRVQQFSDRSEWYSETVVD